MRHAFVLAALALLTLACSSGGGRHHNDPLEFREVTIPCGERTCPLRLSTVVCGPLAIDDATMVRAVEAAFAQARAQIGDKADALLPAAEYIGGFHAHYESNGHRVFYNCDNAADNIRHELQHHFAWMLGHRGDCFMLQDHPGGYDLNCSPIGSR